jgi:hypothetical protein
MWPERTESDAVMYFRMSTAAPDSALSGIRGIGPLAAAWHDKSCIDMGCEHFHLMQLAIVLCR